MVPTGMSSPETLLALQVMPPTFTRPQAFRLSMGSVTTHSFPIRESALVFWILGFTYLFRMGRSRASSATLTTRNSTVCTTMDAPSSAAITAASAPAANQMDTSDTEAPSVTTKRMRSASQI